MLEASKFIVVRRERATDVIVQGARNRPAFCDPSSFQVRLHEEPFAGSVLWSVDISLEAADVAADLQRLR